MAETLTEYAYWIPPPAGGGGVVEAYLSRAYVGDGLAARVIALGAAFDYVEVSEEGNFGTAGTKLWLARSWDNANGQSIAWKAGTAFNFAGGTNASCVINWHGLQTGGTEIHLGNNAGSLTNVNLTNYRIRAWKYSTITP